MIILAAVFALARKSPVLFLAGVLAVYLLITHYASKAVISNVLAVLFVLFVLSMVVRATRSGRRTDGS